MTTSSSVGGARQTSGVAPGRATAVTAAIGNHAGAGLKEQVGPADDAFEREADRIADIVSRGGGRETGYFGWAAASLRGSTLQRQSPSYTKDAGIIRRAPKDAAASTAEPTPVEAEVQPPATAPPPAAAAAPDAAGERDTSAPTTPALLVDDDVEASGGQMRKSEFMAALRAKVCATVDAALKGTGRDSEGCPWIDHWLGYYDERSPSQIERSLHRYAPEAAGVASANQYIAIVAARVGRSAERWATTGEITGMPDDMPGGAMLGGGLLGAFGGMFFKARPGGARHADPASVRQQLGRGQSLPGSVRATMEGAFGTSFASVRLHTDATAARLSSQLNARAFAVGPHVAFGGGEFRPGTLGGDALIAHELAHVMQQGHAETSAGVLHKSNGASPGESSSALEADADRSAAAFVAQRGMQAGPLARVAPRLRAGLTLSRCSSNRPAPVAAGTDFRAGTALPDAAAQAALQRELHPGAAAGGGALAAWDAHSTSPGTPAEKATRKADLKTTVTTAMLDELNLNMPGIRDSAAAGRVPVTQLEGPGNAAKRVVDRQFGDWISVAALTPTQSSLRHGFAFRGSGPGQNLFDANDPAQRTAAGLPVDAHDLAGWLAESAGSAAMTPHSFSPTRGGEEADFLELEIVAPFVTAHQADLELFDLFGFAITDPRTGKIVAPTSLDPALSTAPGAGGAPSPAERSLRWSMWETLAHEYIHTLAHPVFNSAGGANNRIMMEGFCTMFSEEVLLDQIPKAPKDAAIRGLVEGGSFPEPPAGTVPSFEAGIYAEYLLHAKAIRARVGANAVKAAFFQGHVEFIGLDPAGGTSAPVAAVDRDIVSVPAGITTVAELAAAARVPAAEIVAHNAGLTPTSAVAGRVHVPGAREHIVVVAGAHGAETKAQIAQQNGVTQESLAAANPAASWGSLAAGERILIPRR